LPVPTPVRVRWARKLQYVDLAIALPGVLLQRVAASVDRGMTPDERRVLLSLAKVVDPETSVSVPARLLMDLLGSSSDRSASADEVLTQRQAARLLKVSVAYLRASSCPKHLLPGNGRCGKPLVRYLRSQVLEWGLRRVLAPTFRRAS
jgi:hypothetical protein